MRTRKSDTPKSATPKKTPPRAAKAKQSTPRTLSDPSPVVEEEVATPLEEEQVNVSAEGPEKGDAEAVSGAIAAAPELEEAKVEAGEGVGGNVEIKEGAEAKEVEIEEGAEVKEVEADTGLEEPKFVEKEPTLESDDVKEDMETESKGEEKPSVVEKVSEEVTEDVVEGSEPVPDVKGKMVDTSVCDVEQTDVEGGEKDVDHQDQVGAQDEVNFTEGEGAEGEVAAGEGATTALEEEMQNEILDMAKQRKINKEQEIFVGGLDREAVEEDIRKAFETIGEVVNIRLHMDFVTNKNKGFAFVKFTTKEQATRALTELKNPVIRGKRCGIAPSEDNDTLFLGNICNTWTKEAIKRKLKEYGIEGVENITLVEDTQNEGLSRGFAFIEFPCHADATIAYKRLQKPDVVFGHPERTAKVAFAEPLREPDADTMAQVKSVFVDGLPPYWDEERVKEKFKDHGEIERVVLARNMPSAKRNDFGFVNFTSHESAVACIEAINNTELGDEGKSKMKVRARLANPLPKTQAVKGGMSGGFRIGHTSASYSRYGRGSGRGRFPYGRAGFPSGRGFNPRGRGRGGRFAFSDNNFGDVNPEFHGPHPFRGQGGRRGSFRNTYEDPVEEFEPSFITPARRGSFNRGRGSFNRGRILSDRGRGDFFHTRRQPFPLEGDFGGPSDVMHFGEDPYYYGDVGHSMKRPFSVMEHDQRYLGPVSRQRARYDFSDPSYTGPGYRDTMEPAGGLYSDYYSSDFGGADFPSYGGGPPSRGGYYY